MSEKIYVPSHGQRLVMPGVQPDWPVEGQPINPLDRYQHRMVLDGDLVEAPEKPVKGASK